MSIIPREVKNKKNPDGTNSNRAGTVYDVYFRYGHDGLKKTYAQRGFLTKHAAQKHEVEMREQLRDPNRRNVYNVESKQTLEEYLDGWIEEYSANLRENTIIGYRHNIRNHIIPHLGKIQLCNLTPEMIDKMIRSIIDGGLSSSTAKYAQRTLSIALECAKKRKYITDNPAKNIITKFGKGNKTPDPYTVEQIQSLLGYVSGTEWEMIILLGGLYGLRISEVLGLRWKNVDLPNNTFTVCEQLPNYIPAGETVIDELPPVKAGENRVLPITEVTKPYFQRQLALLERQRELSNPYYENDFVISRFDGRPKCRRNVSSDFGQLLKKFNFPHIRFHDLRHSTATNLFQLTGDFYTVSKILGHTMKGVGIQLGISANLDSTTAQYVDVRIDRKLAVLNAYHNAVHPPKTTTAKDNAIQFPIAE